MLPAIGPWADSSHFTDIELLAELGRGDKTIAVGALCNRNLTGHTLAQVAENADLSAAQVHELENGGLCLPGRSPEDQVTIMLAALNRSEAAARNMVPQLDPAAAMIVLRRTQTTRFKGAAALAEALLETVLSPSWVRHAGKDKFLEVYDVAREQVPTYDSTIERIVFRAAEAAGDAEALIALSDDLAAHDGFGPRPIQALLAYTYGNPHVVTHWAGHAGLTGQRIAAADHRQDTELLLTLLPAEDSEVSRLLTENPAIPYEAKARHRAEEMYRMVTDPQPGDDARIVSAAAHAQRLLQSRDHWDGLDPRRLNDPRVAGRIASIASHRKGYAPTPLLAYDLLAAGHRLNDETRSQLRRALVGDDTIGITGTLQAPLAAVVGPERDQDWQVTQRIAPLVRKHWEAVPNRFTADGHATINEFTGVYTRPHHGDVLAWGATWAQENLRTVSEYHELYRVIDENRRVGRLGNRTLAEVAAPLIAASPRKREEAQAAMGELLPSALGAF